MLLFFSITGDNLVVGPVSSGCDQECLNEGICDGNNECLCPDGYFGPLCEYSGKAVWFSFFFQAFFNNHIHYSTMILLVCVCFTLLRFLIQGWQGLKSEQVISIICFCNTKM